VGAQIRNFNAQAQIAQPKFLIGKTQAQIAQIKNKIRKAQAKIAQEKNKIGKAQIANFFQKFNKVQAQIAQRLKKKLIKRKAQIGNIFKSIIQKFIVLRISAVVVTMGQRAVPLTAALCPLVWATLIC